MEYVFLTTTRSCLVAVILRRGGEPWLLNKHVLLTASVLEKMQQTTEHLA